MPPPRALYFDSVIPWERRLRREMPLLEELARAAGGRVLMPACGTGGHVVALAERGFDVLGFDVDEDALALARVKVERASNAISAACRKVELRLLDMAEAARLGPAHDIAFVLGNALPSLSEPGQLLAALRGVADTLRPGGIFFTQNLNYDLRWREKTHTFPVLSGETDDEEVLLVKFADYDEEFINFHAMYLTRPKSGGAWQSHVRRSRQLPLFRDRLTKLLTEAGFSSFEFWGDYARSPFDPAGSNDLIALAKKDRNL